VQDVSKCPLDRVVKDFSGGSCCVFNSRPENNSWWLCYWQACPYHKSCDEWEAVWSFSTKWMKLQCSKR